MKKKITSKWRFYSILLFSFLGAVLAISFICALFYAFRDVLVAIVFVLVSFICALCLFAYALFNHLRYVRENHEASLALSGIAEQLELARVGKPTLLHKEFRNEKLTKLQSDVNDMVANLVSLAPKDSEAEGLEEIDVRKVCDEKDFESIVSGYISNTNSYRSAVLAIKELSSSPITEGSDSVLLKSISVTFEKCLIAKVEPGLYLVFVKDVSSNEELKTKCLEFISIFNYSHIDPNGDSFSNYYCQIGGAVFPYVSITNLVKVAKRSISKTKRLNIDFGELKPALPAFDIVQEKRKRAVLLSSDEYYRKRYFESKDDNTSQKIMKDYMSYYCEVLSLDTCGVLLYEPLSKDYQILGEVNTKGQKGLSLFAQNGILKGKDIDPLFEYAEKEWLTFVSDPLVLPYEISEKLQSLEARSIILLPCIFNLKRCGLIYFISSKKKEFLTLNERERLTSFFTLGEAFLVSRYEKSVAERKSLLVDSLIARSSQEIYTIDSRDYKLVDFTGNVIRYFPEAKIGEPCYKSLMGLDEPCKECPLSKSGGVKRTIDALGPSSQTMCVINRSGSSNEFVSVLIEKERINSNSSSGLFDQALSIYNSKALAHDLNRELRTRKPGYIVSFRICNESELPSSSSGENIDYVLITLLKSLQESGYGDIVYRYDENTLSFLLKAASKNSMTLDVEEIASIIERQIVLTNGSFTPKFSYSAISYPSESDTANEILSLIRTELERSWKIGEGYLAEVGRFKVRKALRSNYVRQILEEKAKQDKVDIDYTCIIETPTNKACGIQFSLKFTGMSGEPITKNEFFPVARENKLIYRLSLAGLAAIKDFYHTYSDSLLKLSRIKYLSYSLDVSVLLDPDFLGQIKKFMESTRIPKKTFVLQVMCSEIVSKEEEIKATIAELDKLGILASAVSYDPIDYDSDILKEIGFSHVRISKTVLEDAILSERSRGEFIKMIAKMDSLGIKPVINGVRTQDEVDFCVSLDLPLYVDGDKRYCLNEQQLVSYLNYRN